MVYAGTPGWGKSYLVAATVNLLFKQFHDEKNEKHVVYIPDCKLLLNENSRVEQMKYALLLSFAHSDEISRQIIQRDTEQEVIQFCQSQPHRSLLFVADQADELSSSSSSSSSASSSSAALSAARNFLMSCYGKHYFVESISINDSVREKIDSKVGTRKRIPLFGPLTSVITSSQSFTM